jgi:hypothetical protein
MRPSKRIATPGGVRAVPSVRQNDQARVEQMNGAVVRHAVGDRRYEGPQAATALAPLYTAAVRELLPAVLRDFREAPRWCEGEKPIILRATPYQRLLADTRISEEVRRQVTTTYVTLDPVRLSQTTGTRNKSVGIADRTAVTTRQSQPPRNEPHSFAYFQPNTDR